MSFLRRIISGIGAAQPAGGPAMPRTARTVGGLIRRRGRIALRRASAALAPAPDEESNEAWPEAGSVPAAPPEVGGLPSVRRKTAVPPPVSEPRGVAGNGRALLVGPGKQEVSRDFYERIESSSPECADKSVSNPDAKDLSVQGAVVVVAPSESPSLRPASSLASSAASLPASAASLPGAPPPAVMRAHGDALAAPRAAPHPQKPGEMRRPAAGIAPQPPGFAPQLPGVASVASRPQAGAGAIEAEALGAVESPAQDAAPLARPDVLHPFSESQFEPVPPPGAAALEVPAAEAPAPEPTVHIGSIEIIIEAAAEPRAAPAPAAAAPDLASRFYLRGL